MEILYEESQFYDSQALLGIIFLALKVVLRLYIILLKLTGHLGRE